MICVVIVERGGDDEVAFQRDVAAAVQDLDADGVFVGRPAATLTPHDLQRIHLRWYKMKQGDDDQPERGTPDEW